MSSNPLASEESMDQFEIRDNVVMATQMSQNRVIEFQTKQHEEKPKALHVWSDPLSVCFQSVLNSNTLSQSSKFEHTETLLRLMSLRKRLSLVVFGWFWVLNLYQLLQIIRIYKQQPPADLHYFNRNTTNLVISIVTLIIQTITLLLCFAQNFSLN